MDREPIFFLDGDLLAEKSEEEQDAIIDAWADALADAVVKRLEEMGFFEGVEDDAGDDEETED